MSDQPRDLTLERVNRLSQAVADLMEGQATQNRNMIRLLGQMSQQLDRIEANQAALTNEVREVAKEVREVASEQILLANRVENALAQAFRTNLRVDEMQADRGDG